MTTQQAYEILIELEVRIPDDVGLLEKKLRDALSNATDFQETYPSWVGGHYETTEDAVQISRKPILIVDEFDYISKLREGTLYKIAIQLLESKNELTYIDIFKEIDYKFHLILGDAVYHFMVSRNPKLIDKGIKIGRESYSEEEIWEMSKRVEQYRMQPSQYMYGKHWFQFMGLKLEDIRLNTIPEVCYSYCFSIKTIPQNQFLPITAEPFKKKKEE